MKYDASILIPSIRSSNWNQVLSTLKQSCKKHKYEVVFSGPFDPPSDVDMTDVKHIKTYANPSIAAQMGAAACEGELLVHNVDDARFIPDALDKAIDLYKEKCGYKDLVCLPYTEDDDYTGKTFPLDFWYAHYHSPLRLAGIPSHFKIALHFLMNKQYFMELGGLDCNYSYLNFNLHCLIFRLQADGGVVHIAPTDVTNCNHYGNGRVDHKVIEDVYPEDYARFLAKYSNPNVFRDNPIRIDFDHWKQLPQVWTKRFKKLYKTYEEMLADK